MQQDMHYYGTYAMARAAGLAPGACQTIATAAQFVDDNGDKTHISFPDGGRLGFVPTAHHTRDTKNIDLDDQRLVWLPFHFIPGNEGDSMSERLLCRKDSEVAREMVAHNLSQAGKPFGLYLAGITAHVYADTFSHYGFSGMSSRWNKVDESSFRLTNLNPGNRNYIEKKTQAFMEKYAPEMGGLPNFRKALGNLQDRVAGGVAEGLSGALGHGAVLTYPDRPYLKWQFDYEHPEKRPSGLRDNPATYLEACEKLHGMFQKLGEQEPSARQDGGRAFGEIKDVVERVLATQAPREDREKAWRQAAGDGELFTGAEEILPNQGESWKRELDALKEAEDSSAALGTSVFRFYQAAALHRTFVLRELLPRHGLVAN